MMTQMIDPLEWQAYLDGELEATKRARIESAIADDPSLAERLARDMRLRGRLHDAFDPVMDEPMPARFAALLDAPPVADTVVPMRPSTGRGRSLPAWLGYAAAASLAAIALAGAWQRAQAPLRLQEGALVAGGELSRALDTTLASAPTPDARIAIGLTFRDREGRICRSFGGRAGMPTAGLACRDGDAWRLRVVSADGDSGAEDSVRQAASGAAPEVQAAIDATLQGEVFDAEQERAARDAHWR